MGTIDPLKSESLILFDGFCNLCSSSVQFIIKRDATARFKFASLQSPVGQSQLKRFNLPVNQFYSIVLIQDGVARQRSDAALQIARHLDGLWPALSILRFIPRFVRDGVYDFISRNRYSWFGKKDSCMIPTPDLKSRFLE